MRLGNSMEFIVLGTRYKKDREGKVTIREPFKVYAISSVKRGIGMPPFYRVEDIKNGELELQELYAGTQEYTHVLKWVGIADRSRKSKYGGRFLLKDNSTASGHINQEKVRKFISYGSVAV